MIASLMAYSSYMYLPHYTVNLLTELNILKKDSLRMEAHLLDKDL